MTVIFIGIFPEEKEYEYAERIQKNTGYKLITDPSNLHEYIDLLLMGKDIILVSHLLNNEQMLGRIEVLTKSIKHSIEMKYIGISKKINEEWLA
jgi:hypothetical protein